MLQKISEANLIELSISLISEYVLKNQMLKNL